MIASVHLADVGPRAVPRLMRRQPEGLPGLKWAVMTVAAPLGPHLLPRPKPGRVGLVAAWDDDAALDRFLSSHPVALRLAGGWHARLEPIRAVGAWSALPELPRREQPVDEGERVAVLTLGRLKLTRLLPFLGTSAAAEGQAVSDPAVEHATALARPPGLVATFSLWRSAAEMRAYATGGSGPSHRAAVTAHAARPFHHESVFVRFRPYAEQGAWW